MSPMVRVGPETHRSSREHHHSLAPWHTVNFGQEQDLPGDPGKVSDTAEQVHHILPGTQLKTGIATGKKMRRPRFRVTALAAFERINPIGGLAPPRLFQQANHG
jgi:hypothetical protein